MLAAPNPALAAPKFAAIAVDARSGKVLFSKNADAPRFPASLTKIMTLYLIFEDLKAGKITLKTRVPFSKFAASRQPSKLGVRAGKSITIEQAILALVTKSANDAATAVAEKLEGTETAFARRMTRTARRLGMTRTTFRNASGLPNASQKTTARDMATLGLRIQRDHPKYYSYFKTRRFKFGRARYGNHNRLLGRVKGVDGIKTGYTRASGFNLTTSARRGKNRVVAVVMGGRSGKSRNAYMTRLVNRMFLKKKLTNGTHLALVAGKPPGYKGPAKQAPAKQLAQAPTPRKKPVTAAATSVAEASTTPQITAQVNPPAAPGATQGATPGATQEVIAEPDRLALHQVVVSAPEESAQSDEERSVDTNSAAFLDAQPLPVDLLSDLAALVAAEDISAVKATAQKDQSRIEPETASASIAVNTAPAATEIFKTEATAVTTGTPVIAMSVAAPDQDSETADVASPVTTATASPTNHQPDAPQPQDNHTNHAQSWNIQLGAFPTHDSAASTLERARSRVTNTLRNKPGFIMKVNKGASVLHRARFSGFSKKTARRACRALSRRGLACLALPPQS